MTALSFARLAMHSHLLLEYRRYRQGGRGEPEREPLQWRYSY